jgi:hypothetical protein
MSGDLERCWLCAKIVPKATNPPDIAADDLCDCADPESGVTVDERIEDLQRQIDKIVEDES